MTQHVFQAIPSAPLQPGDSPEVIGLWVDYPTGRSSFLTFETAFERGLFVIGWSGKPLDLRPVTYTR